MAGRWPETPHPRPTVICAGADLLRRSATSARAPPSLPRTNPSLVAALSTSARTSFSSTLRLARLAVSNSSASLVTRSPVWAATSFKPAWPSSDLAASVALVRVKLGQPENRVSIVLHRLDRHVPQTTRQLRPRWRYGQLLNPELRQISDHRQNPINTRGPARVERPPAELCCGPQGMKLGPCRWCAIEDDLAILLAREPRRIERRPPLHRPQRRLEQGG